MSTPPTRDQEIQNLTANDTLIFEDMSSDVYHAHEGISSTQIKDALNSMLYFDNKYNKGLIKQPDADHFCVGRLTHTLILEPHKTHDEYMQMPPIPKPNQSQRERYDRWVKRGKPDKSEYKDYPTDIMIERCEFWDSLDPGDKTLVDKEQWDLANNMANACKANPAVARMLSYKDVEIENSYFKRDGNTGFVLKARPDIKINNMIADVKSISLRTRPDEHHLINVLRSEVYRRHYHVSAAMYCDIADADEFILIFVNKEPNYHWVAVVEMNFEMISKGRAIYLEALSKIEQCTKTGVWPGPESIAIETDEDNTTFTIPIL